MGERGGDAAPLGPTGHMTTLAGLILFASSAHLYTQNGEPLATQCESQNKSSRAAISSCWIVANKRRRERWRACVPLDGCTFAVFAAKVARFECVCVCDYVKRWCSLLESRFETGALACVCYVVVQNWNFAVLSWHIGLWRNQCSAKMFCASWPSRD